MPSTTHPEFNANTEAIEVAKVFAKAIQGKSVIVTGVNHGGIGFAIAEAFASQAPAHLILAGRTPSKIEECANAIKAKFPHVGCRNLRIDISSQESVRQAAAEVLSWSDVPVINILVNSAGVMLVPERTLTKEGIELHFATNHIGHFLFTCLIMPKLIKAAEASGKGTARVINVTSGSPTAARMRWSDINFEKINKDLPENEQPSYEWMKRWGYTGTENMSYVPLEGYNQSKVANVLFGIAANKRLFEKHGVLSMATHPGVIQTELGRQADPSIKDAVKGMLERGDFTYKTLGAGASTTMVAALDPSLAVGVGSTENGSENYGAFLMDCQITDKAQPMAVSSSEAERLWLLSEDLVKQKFAW